MATHTDIHRHPAGEVDTLRLVGATITIVYITPTQMRIMAQWDTHHAPFFSDPQWPARHVLQAYLRACATKAGRDMPGPKDIDTAYKAFQRQHPRPRPSEHETPNDGGTTHEEPTPSAEGLTPPRGRAVGGGRVPDPGRPTSRQKAPPPGTLMPPPQRATPARKSARCGVGDGSLRPHPPAPTASGYRAPAARPEGGQSGVGERPTRDAPHPGRRRPPGHPHGAPTTRKASSQERALWGW